MYVKEAIFAAFGDIQAATASIELDRPPDPGETQAALEAIARAIVTVEGARPGSGAPLRVATSALDVLRRLQRATEAYAGGDDVDEATARALVAAQADVMRRASALRR